MFDNLTIGAWVITAADCPVRFLPNPQERRVTLILGDPHHEFEISLDATTLGVILREGTQALHKIQDGYLHLKELVGDAGADTRSQL